MRAPSNYTDDLRLAHILADSVDGLTMKRFKSRDLTVDTKPDLTPVTDADREAEQVIRGQLGRVRNRDAVIGEEFGSTGHSPRQWVIDPIDGTANFVRGVPVWATLIGLIEDGEVVVGLVSAPALSRRWWAAEGTGAWRSFATPAVPAGDQVPSAAPRKLSVSKVCKIEDASVAISSLSGWADRGLRDQLLSLTDRAWRLRGYGDFWSYLLVAEGAVDVAAEPEVNLWDLAALAPIVEQAGGRFTDITGVDGPHGGSAIATNGLLHEETVSELATQ